MISFHFIKSNKSIHNFDIKFVPSNKIVNISLDKAYNYTIGEKEIYDIFSLNVKYDRLVESDLMKGNNKIKYIFHELSNMKEAYIEDGLYEKILNNKLIFFSIDLRVNNKIRVDDIDNYDVNCMIGKNSSRNLCYILTDYEVKVQIELIKIFNAELNILREKYSSLFIPAYMDFNKKRMPFSMYYNLLGYCYNKYFGEK